MHRSTTVRINLALGIGAVLVLLVAVGAYRTISALIDDAQRVTHAQQSFILLEKVGSSLKAAESAQRKFLLAPDDQDLQDYEQARAKVGFAMGRLNAEDDLESSEKHLPALAGSIAKRLDMLDRAVEIRRRDGLAAAIAVVDSDLNRQLKEEIDTLSDTLVNSKMRGLRESQTASASSARTAVLLIAAGGLLTLVLVVGVLFSLNLYRSERRRVEDQLRDSESLSRAVTDSMAEGVITSSDDGRITEANRAALQLFGYRRDELIGRHVTQLMPERYRGEFELLIDDLRARKDGFKEAGREVLAMRGDGSEFPVTVSFGDVVVAGKRLFSAIIRDITESTRIAHALRTSEAQLRQITNAVPALIAYVDSDRRFIFHNNAFQQALGLTTEQINGKTLREVVGDALYESVSPKIDQVLAGQTVTYERAQGTTILGGRDYAITYVPQHGADEQQGRVTGFFVMAIDITEMKRMDRMKSEFVSTVSHELRTPLTSIRGSLGLIAGGVAGVLPDAVKNLVDIAKSNCERLIRLINDILDIEKIESGQMRLALQVVAFQPLLQQALAVNQGFAGQHGVTLRLQAPDAAVLVNIDTDRTIQVLTNLLSNAVKFSPRCATVEITLSTNGERVRVEVRDHGPGIPDEFRQRIFQKFSQADSSDSRLKGGTGLGLNISKAIVEKLGGSIGFSGAPGGGTIFFFELPQFKELPATAAANPAGLRPHVLVCEDDQDVARLIGMMLEKAGFDTDLVYSGKQALAHLAARSYAAMTVDLNLPEQDGVALITAVRREARTANLPIVVISVTAEEGRIRCHNQSLSVSDWLAKPIDESLLIRSLRGAIKSMAAGRPRILHVEDDVDIQRIAAAITQKFATFEFAATLPEARARLQEHQFDLILLDLALPGGSGWDLFADIEALQPRPPVVVFSASDVKVAENCGAAAILVKAQTTNDQLLATIQRVLKINPTTDHKDH